MKSLVVGLFVIFASVAAVSANSISVTVDGTTYACTPGAGQVDCDKKVVLLVEKLNLCTNDGYGAMSCIDKIWPGFKSANPTCIEEGASYCLNKCKAGGYSVMQCLDKCQ